MPGRIPFEACPLCGEPAILDLMTFDCSRHPLFRPPLPGTMSWCECYRCRHVFTDGYFDEAAMQVLLSAANAAQTPEAANAQRVERWRPVVERVAQAAGAGPGRWLDIGFGDGALLMAAREQGYAPLGIDLRAQCVEQLNARGIEARRLELEALEEPAAFAVVSMADVLEHMPFPKRALEHAARLLEPRGILFVSLPDRDCEQWRALDRDRRNPYWMEIEHFHNFGQARLGELLREVGLEPLRSDGNLRYLCGLDVIARRP